jgi:hypothetical protein
MQSTVRRRQHRVAPRAIRTLLLPSREALLCDSLLAAVVFPALVRLVHAACRTSALNQNHVALVTLLRSCLRTIAAFARYAAALRRHSGLVSGVYPFSDTDSHAKHSPILREGSDPATRRHLTGQAPGFPFGRRGRGLVSGMVDRPAINF